MSTRITKQNRTMNLSDNAALTGGAAERPSLIHRNNYRELQAYDLVEVSTKSDVLQVVMLPDEPEML